jgi:hypothetical protein
MLHCLLGSDCRATPLVKRAAGCGENSCAKVRLEGLAFLPLEHISDFWRFVMMSIPWCFVLYNRCL